MGKRTDVWEKGYCTREKRRKGNRDYWGNHLTLILLFVFAHGDRRKTVKGRIHVKKEIGETHRIELVCEIQRRKGRIFPSPTFIVYFYIMLFA